MFWVKCKQTKWSSKLIKFKFHQDKSKFSVTNLFCIHKDFNMVSNFNASGGMRSIDEIMREARERIDACFAAMDGRSPGQQSSQPAASLMAFPEEVGDLMSFTPNILEPQRLMPYRQTPLPQRIPLECLQSGPRTTREQDEEIRRQQERKLKELQAQGRMPQGFELPDVPEQPPDWAQSVSYDQSSMPHWPQLYPGEEEALPPPWPEEYYDDYVPPPPKEDVLGQFDPLFDIPTEQARPATSHYGELAPTWDATPSFARYHAPPPPREVVDEFDPYATSSAAHATPRSNYAELIGSPPSHGARGRSPGASTQRTATAATSPEFVAEVGDIVKQTRARLNRAMQKEFGQDLNTVLKKK